MPLLKLLSTLATCTLLALTAQAQVPTGYPAGASRLAAMPTYRVIPGSDEGLTPIVFDAERIEDDGDMRVLVGPTTPDGVATLRVPAAWPIEEVEAT